MSDLLTIEQFAALMGWSPKTIYMRRYRGDSLPRAITLGTVIRYRREDIESWLEEHTDKKPAPANG